MQNIHVMSAEKTGPCGLTTASAAHTTEHNSPANGSWSSADKDSHCAKTGHWSWIWSLWGSSTCSLLNLPNSELCDTRSWDEFSKIRLQNVNRKWRKVAVAAQGQWFGNPHKPRPSLLKRPSWACDQLNTCCLWMFHNAAARVWVDRMWLTTSVVLSELSDLRSGSVSPLTLWLYMCALSIVLASSWEADEVVNASHWSRQKWSWWASFCLYPPSFLSSSSFDIIPFFHPYLMSASLFPPCTRLLLMFLPFIHLSPSFSPFPPSLWFPLSCQ